VIVVTPEPEIDESLPLTPLDGVEPVPPAPPSPTVTVIVEPPIVNPLCVEVL
jgi:hypothetical protein